jgi:hypothetical protein
MGLDMTLHVIEEEEMTSELLAEQDYEYWAKGEHFYWRKANSIHNWFVKNVQGGTDDCGIYEVTFDQLMSLKSKVASVLADNRKGPKLLPTTAGFFFGSTEYDDWYLEDLVLTMNHLNECELMYGANPDSKFFYSSSW